MSPNVAAVAVRRIPTKPPVPPRRLLLLLRCYCYLAAIGGAGFVRDDDGTDVVVFASALPLEPGMGFASAPKARDGQVSRSSPVLRVVVFEHTSQYGTGGLVYNQPTPIRLKDLAIPRFLPWFAENALMLGCGVSADDSAADDDDDNGNGNSLAMGDMAPWFWLHDIPALAGSSTRLQGASGPLYMGGNIDDAAALIEDGAASPEDFKFFTRYAKWEPGQLEDELARGGKWTHPVPQHPDEVLKPYNIL